MEVSVLNTTMVIIKIGSLSLQTYIYSFSAILFLYNPAFSRESATVNYEFLNGKIIATKETNASFVSQGQQIRAFNTLYGLSAISVPFDASVNLGLQFVSGTQIKAYSASLNSFAYEFLAVYSQYCDYRTPYYKQDSGLCYSQCPQTQPSEHELKCGCFDSDGIFTADSACSNPDVKFIIIGSILGAILLIVIALIIKRCF